MDLQDEVRERIREHVTTHPVVLYMKGTPRAPLCGFSAKAVQVLQANGLPHFFSVNVLEDALVREGVKAYSNWPTLPQLYVRGKFVGGCDIMLEMHRSGEMKALLDGLAAVE